MLLRTIIKLNSRVSPCLVNCTCMHKKCAVFRVRKCDVRAKHRTIRPTNNPTTTMAKRNAMKSTSFTISRCVYSYDESDVSDTCAIITEDNYDPSPRWGAVKSRKKLVETFHNFNSEKREVVTIAVSWHAYYILYISHLCVPKRDNYKDTVLGRSRCIE